MEYISEEGFIEFEKYPEEVRENYYILIENPDNIKESVLGAYATEIEALKIFRKVSHHRKKVVKGNAIYKTILGTTVLWGYEEIKE